MIIDREFQRNILELLREEYPGGVPVRALPRGEKESGATIAYLSEHGLVSSTIHGGGTRPIAVYVSEHIAYITAKGLDFLEEDGGLTAILGTVTVRLDKATLSAIVGKVEASKIPPDMKARLLEQLRGLPGKAAEKLLLGALDIALKNPDTLARLVEGLGGR